MASYVEQALTRGESVLHLGRTSWWSLSGYLVLGVVLLPVGVGLILLALAWVKQRSTELAVTNKRVITKFGFIQRDTVELNIQKVESVQVQQGIMGRMLDFGTIVIAGGGSPQAPVPGISDPMGFRRAFLEAQETALKERATPASPD
ncbi:MAG: PH domain-containing protein [Rhodocyclaceae bacterium]|nr:PH domain-containing protein [Rhodocyclaceae bacterium]MCA4904830.1 PH domain-containing protein [Rhodocyclaceae bacterium]